MSRFIDCLRFVLEQEGGYSNHPADHGGATNYGVTQVVYDTFRQRRNLPQQPVKEIGQDEVAEIYRKSYWAAASCDLLPAPLDLVVFDAAVNSGVSQGVKFAQRALGVDDDGKVGPQTIASAQADAKLGMMMDVCVSALRSREHFYHGLCNKNPSQKVFLNGWLNRIGALTQRVMHEFKIGTDPRSKP